MPDNVNMHPDASLPLRPAKSKKPSRSSRTVPSEVFDIRTSSKNSIKQEYIRLMVARERGNFDNSPKDKALHNHVMRMYIQLRPFQPCHMFFYGSLMDPDVLATVLRLPKSLSSPPPVMKPASISGFKLKIWGIYPTLVPSDSGTVTGLVWKIESEEHFNRLVAYETAVYASVECKATLGDGTVLGKCRTFCWAGASNSKELEDGVFDLQVYQRNFKRALR